MNRLLITGTNSGSGKTTVTCALLWALNTRGQTPVAFKCGPDYIDPMFHREITEIKAYNLDPFFMDKETLCSHLTSKGGRIAIIEGAMGYYDGIGATDISSSYAVARDTGTPSLLVVNAKGAGLSLGAVMEGFVHFRPHSQIKGVIFNNAKASRYTALKAMAKDTGLKSYGYMPPNEKWALPSRHLGLLTASEIAGIGDILEDIGRQAEKTLDIDGLLALSATALPLRITPPYNNIFPAKIRLAVAKDNAFSFLYQENIELLESLGCEIVFFSPLKDKALPPNINGLYLCGGYPELYGETLSANTSMKESIRQAVEKGLPTIAEGGGFLYLHEKLGCFSMCGVIQSSAYETKSLVRFGYITLTATKDNLLCRAGESIPSREFHYWESQNPGQSFTAEKPGGGKFSCIHTTPTLYAGFPQLYFPAKLSFGKNFIERMAQYEHE